MFLMRIPRAGLNRRPLVSSFLQSCTQILRCTDTSETCFSRWGMRHFSSDLTLSGGVFSSFSSSSTSNIAFNPRQTKIVQQQPQTNAGEQPNPSARSGVCWLQLSSPRLAKMGPSKGRGPLIAKFAPVGFKKGFGAVGLGRHTKKGFFLINYLLVPKYHFPDLQNFQLKPYVCRQTFKMASQKFWNADEN